MQSLFARGLVIVVGSGASCALGLPGMSDLATHLQSAIPSTLTSRHLSHLAEWTPIAEKLEIGLGLEDALVDADLPGELSEIIADEIATRILGDEERAIGAILASDDHSAFGKLFSHVLKTAPIMDVITTNYDRLLEVHAARSDVRVESMFYGHTVGRFDPVRSRESMQYAEQQVGRRRIPSVRTKPHIRLSKPHGSLDWFTYNGQHYRSDLSIPGARRIVAPGGNKYRLGYEIPFDEQRQRANAAIDAAAALLFVGYGFNDDHLQTHIRETMRDVPSLTISRTITESAKRYLELNRLAIGIESAGHDNSRSQITQGGDSLIVDQPIWDLEHLVKEVLGK